MRARSGELTPSTLPRRSRVRHVRTNFPPGFRRCVAARLCVRMCHEMRVVEKRQLLSAEEIGRTLSRLAHEIVENSGGAKDLALIGVRRRGVPLSERLASQIRDFARVEVPVGTLDITLYRDDLSPVGS